MDRLPGVLDGEGVYGVDLETDDPDLGQLIVLGFTDVAAHPYSHLVDGTVGVLAAVPGVRAVWRDEREVIHVAAPGVAIETLTDVVDRYWLHQLARVPVLPEYADDPITLHLPPGAADVALPPSATPPPPPGVGGHTPRGDRSRAEMRELRTGLRDAVRLPASRRRMWTYLGFGIVPLGLGAVAAATPGGSTGLLLLAVGTLNTVIGLRIAARRRAESA